MAIHKCEICGKNHHPMVECSEIERVSCKSQSAGSAFVSPWDDMMEGLNKLANDLYATWCGDEGALVSFN